MESCKSFEALLAAKLTNFGIITLMGYASENDFTTYQPVFQEIATNLELQPDIRYASGSGSSDSSGSSPFNALNIGIVLLALVVFRLLIKKILYSPSGSST